MVGSGKIIAQHLAHAIGEKNTQVISEHCVAHSGLDTNAGRAAGKDEVPDSERADRELFLQVLGQVCERFNWICHAYCLMGNHYHLLVETREGNLAQGMRQLNGVYTQGFNRKNRRVGHVFQGRYKAILVHKDSYLLELARYIVLNPVRAQMVRSAREWRWSSYRATCGQAAVPGWLQTDWILSTFGKRKTDAIERYQAFVAQGKGQLSPWQQLKNQIYLGDEQFVAQMQKQLTDDALLDDIPILHKRPVAKPLADYARKYKTRDEAIMAAYRSGGYNQKEIADYFELHYSRVSRIIKNAEQARIKT